jgi:hypothetical protein
MTGSEHAEVQEQGDEVLQALALYEATRAGDSEAIKAMYGWVDGRLSDPDVIHGAFLRQGELTRGLLAMVAALDAAGILPEGWQGALRRVAVAVIADEGDVNDA